jgi:DNA-binding CsgD family transcriptional regulator
MESWDPGIPGVHELDTGAHLCAFYSGAAGRDNLLRPFLMAGLRGGDKCLCLLDQAEPGEALHRLVEDAREFDCEGSAPHLQVERASSIYLRSGRFSAEHMTTFLADVAAEATKEDFSRLRAAGEMSWVLPGAPGAEDFFAYESALNDLVTRVHALLMCMYDLERFGISMLVDVLKTHPMVLVDETVLDNQHYMTPAQYLATHQEAPTYPLATIPPGRKHVPGDRDTWETLTEAEHRIAHLVAAGMTNKAIADELTLSRHTIDAHLKHIYAKLDIHSRVELTVLAMQRGRGPLM